MRRAQGVGEVGDIRYPGRARAGGRGARAGAAAATSGVGDRRLGAHRALGLRADDPVPDEHLHAAGRGGTAADRGGRRLARPAAGRRAGADRGPARLAAHRDRARRLPVLHRLGGGGGRAGLPGLGRRRGRRDRGPAPGRGGHPGQPRRPGRSDGADAAGIRRPLAAAGAAGHPGAGDPGQPAVRPVDARLRPIRVGPLSWAEHPGTDVPVADPAAWNGPRSTPRRRRGRTCPTSRRTSGSSTSPTASAARTAAPR